MKKTKWIQFASLCLLLSLTVACGGKNSSGGGSESNALIGNIDRIDSKSSFLSREIRGTPYGNSVVELYNEAINYRNKADDSISKVLAGGFTRGQIQQSSNDQNCSNGTFLYFFNYEYCKKSNSSGGTITFVGTPTQVCTVIDKDDKLRVKSKKTTDLIYDRYSCSLKDLERYNKEKNSELNDVLTLKNGNWQLYGAERDRMDSNIIYLLVGERNSGPKTLYAINKGYHTVYNPVSIQDYRTGNSTNAVILQR